MHQVNVDEAATQLSTLIDAAVRGEIVLITTSDHQTIRLVPMMHAKQPRRPGRAKGMISLADDFDAPLDDFREYIA
jgi:antitoxin (DNA-binding transcriptional repressor) of toxin-antitoxin stability system